MLCLYFVVIVQDVLITRPVILPALTPAGRAASAELLIACHLDLTIGALQVMHISVGDSQGSSHSEAEIQPEPWVTSAKGQLAVASAGEADPAPTPTPAIRRASLLRLAAVLGSAAMVAAQLARRSRPQQALSGPQQPTLQPGPMGMVAVPVLPDLSSYLAPPAQLDAAFHLGVTERGSGAKIPVGGVLMLYCAALCCACCAELCCATYNCAALCCAVPR